MIKVPLVSSLGILGYWIFSSAIRDPSYSLDSVSLLWLVRLLAGTSVAPRVRTNGFFL